jgi:hypothetical protein
VLLGDEGRPNKGEHSEMSRDQRKPEEQIATLGTKSVKALTHGI